MLVNDSDQIVSQDGREARTDIEEVYVTEFLVEGRDFFSVSKEEI